MGFLARFDVWQEGHPVDVLKHKDLCAGTREKARNLRAEFDVYVLSFPQRYVCLHESLCEIQVVYKR